jgi:hypothetical protein
MFTPLDTTRSESVKARLDCAKSKGLKIIVESEDLMPITDGQGCSTNMKF